MIAGLTYTEMHPLPPGLICDLYLLRVRYDDEQHGIKRKPEEMPDWNE